MTVISITQACGRCHRTRQCRRQSVRGVRLRGEADRAFEWLERAYAQHDAGLSQIKGDPLLKSVEPDPRCAAFLKKMRLAS